MSVSSSKNVKTSASTRNVDMIIVRYSAKSRRIMSSRMSGKRALNLLRCEAVTSPRLPVESPRRVPIACTFCKSSFHPAVRLPISMGIRSTRHSRNSPQTKKKMLPIHEPNHGDIFPWRAICTPSSEKK